MAAQNSRLSKNDGILSGAYEIRCLDNRTQHKPIRYFPTWIKMIDFFILFMGYWGYATCVASKVAGT